MLKSKRGGDAIWYENIAAPEFSPADNQGISLADAMATIHVILPDGSVAKGMPALTLLYNQVGLGWVFRLAKLPLFSQAADLLYQLVSKNRTALGGALDGVLAVGRINAEERGAQALRTGG